jgi:hypothetical protein
MQHRIGHQLAGQQEDHIRVDAGLPEYPATKTRAARTRSGTAGIVKLWRNSAAHVKDTDPPGAASAWTGREQRRTQDG